MSEQVSFVKAVQTYFSTNPHGRKVEIAEFKGLTQKDKEDLRAMLIADGLDVAPLVTK